MKFFKKYLNAYINPEQYDREGLTQDEWCEHFSEPIEKKLKSLYPNQMIKNMEINRDKPTPRLKVTFYSETIPYIYIRDYPRNIEVTDPKGIIFSLPIDGKL